LAVFLDHQVREFAGRFGEVRDLRPRDLVDLPALAGVLAHLEEAQPDLVGVAVRGHVVVATEGREVVVNGVFDSERWVASSVTPAPSSSFSAATIRMVFSVVRSGGVDVRSMVVSVVARFVSRSFLAAEPRESRSTSRVYYRTEGREYRPVEDAGQQLDVPPSFPRQFCPTV
jgi:hypothetical protein